MVPLPGELTEGPIFPSRPAVEKPPGEWNRLELICVDGKALHVVNGKVLTVITEFRGTLQDKDVPVTRGGFGFGVPKGKSSCAAWRSGRSVRFRRNSSSDRRS